jgi:hypothetical protein
MATPTGIALLDHFAALPDPRQHAKVLEHGSFRLTCIRHR